METGSIRTFYTTNCRYELHPTRTLSETKFRLRSFPVGASLMFTNFSLGSAQFVLAKCHFCRYWTPTPPKNPCVRRPGREGCRPASCHGCRLRPKHHPSAAITDKSDTAPRRPLIGGGWGGGGASRGLAAATPRGAAQGWTGPRPDMVPRSSLLLHRTAALRPRVG